MLTPLRLAFALLVSVCATCAGAQTMYRCGSTYSQTPCGAGQKEVEIKVDDPRENDANKYSSTCIMRPYKPAKPTADALALEKVEKQRAQDAARWKVEAVAAEQKAGNPRLQDAMAKAQRQAEVIPDTPPNSATIAKNQDLCRKAAIEQLKDPESARITEMQRVGARNFELAKGDWAIGIFYRMNVNAKNSYGGYVGKKPWECHFTPGEKELKGAYPLS